MAAANFSLAHNGTIKGVVVDAVVGLKKRKYEVSISVQNVLNSEYNDAQFDTKSQLKGEPVPVTELHFTPSAPFFLKGSLSYFFKKKSAFKNPLDLVSRK